MTKDNKIDQFEKKIDILGFLMVVLPLISSILLWYWFLYIQVLLEMKVYITVVSITTIFLTSILATLDSNRLDHKVTISKKKDIYGGSFLKFFIFLLLWIYSYPVYLLRRKKFGSRNLFYPIIMSLIIFIMSSLYIYYAQYKFIEEDSFKRRVRNSRRFD